MVGLTAGRSRVVAVVPRYAARHTTKLAEPRKDESVSARGLNKLHNYNNGAAGGGGWVTVTASKQSSVVRSWMCVCVWCCACCVRRRARERMAEPFSALRSAPFTAIAGLPVSPSSPSPSLSHANNNAINRVITGMSYSVGRLLTPLEWQKKKKSHDSSLALLVLPSCWSIGAALVAVEDPHSLRQRVARKCWALAFDASSIRRIRARQVVTTVDRI